MTTEAIQITPAVPDPPELDYILWADFGPSIAGEVYDVSYDVGANCGQTLQKIKSFSETVVAFEPSVESYSYLLKHFTLGEGYRISPQAVSSHVGHVGLVAMPGKIETGQLVTAGTPGMEWSEGVSDGVMRNLPCITLDWFIETSGVIPGFVKIDVEGHEMEVLRGASKMIRSEWRPQMLIEVHSEPLGAEIRELLESKYEIATIRHPHYVPGTLLWRTHFWFRCFPC